MRKYTEALNYILKQRSHRIIMDDITVAFWAMDGGDEHEMALQEFLWVNLSVSPMRKRSMRA